MRVINSWRLAGEEVSVAWAWSASKCCCQRVLISVQTILIKPARKALGSEVAVKEREVGSSGVSRKNSSSSLPEEKDSSRDCCMLSRSDWWSVVARKSRQATVKNPRGKRRQPIRCCAGPIMGWRSVGSAPWSHVERHAV